MIYIFWSLFFRIVYKRCLKIWVGELEGNDFIVFCKWFGRFEDNGDIWLYFERWEVSIYKYFCGKVFFFNIKENKIECFVIIL